MTVADFYETAGVSGDYLTNKYGWVNEHDISHAKIYRVPSGYMVEFPNPIQLGD